MLIIIIIFAGGGAEEFFGGKNAPRKKTRTVGTQHPSSKPFVQPTGPSEYSSELEGRHLQELFDETTP